MPLKIRRSRATLGIDLGHHTFKAVQAESTAAGWRVLRADSIATPGDAIRDGVVVDPDLAAEALRTLLRQARIPAGKVSISVAGASVVVRTVKIPVMPEATLRKSIKFEAGRYVPTSIADSFIEFEIIGTGADGQMDVLIVAAPKDIVETRVRACELAGLEVEAVDIEPFAAYRALIEFSHEPPIEAGAVALIDVGAHTTNVSVVARGLFAMTRSIPQGGATLSEALKGFFKLSDADAEAGKSQLNLRDLLSGTPQENPPLRVLQPHVDDLVREMRRSLNYYQSQQTDPSAQCPVTCVVLSGGGAQLNGLADYVADKLGLPVRNIGVYDNQRIVPPAGDDIVGGYDYTVATGLAMRPVGRAA